MKKFWILCLVLAGCIAPEVKEELVWTVRQMQGAPAGEMGIELGVSACYAGTYNGWLLMAGGCNFRKYRPRQVERKGSIKEFMWQMGRPIRCLFGKR